MLHMHVCVCVCVCVRGNRGKLSEPNTNILQEGGRGPIQEGPTPDLLLHGDGAEGGRPLTLR